MESARHLGLVDVVMSSSRRKSESQESHASSGPLWRPRKERRLQRHMLYVYICIYTYIYCACFLHRQDLGCDAWCESFCERSPTFWLSQLLFCSGLDLHSDDSHVCEVIEGMAPQASRLAMETCEKTKLNRRSNFWMTRQPQLTLQQRTLTFLFSAWQAQVAHLMDKLFAYFF